MSSNKDILPPKIIKDKGAIHPINHMKDSIMNLLVSLGFEIIDQSNFYLPVSNKDGLKNISEIGKESIILPMGRTEITRPIKALDIILRTCASVNMLTQSKKRIFEKDKEEYTKRTLISLVNSVHYAKEFFKYVKFKIHIIDHNSSKNQINDIKIILDKSNLNFEILNLKFEEYSNLIEKINEEEKEVTNKK